MSVEEKSFGLGSKLHSSDINDVPTELEPLTEQALQTCRPKGTLEHSPPLREIKSQINEFQGLRLAARALDAVRADGFY